MSDKERFARWGASSKRTPCFGIGKYVLEFIKDNPSSTCRDVWDSLPSVESPARLGQFLVFRDGRNVVQVGLTCGDRTRTVSERSLEKYFTRARSEASNG